MNFHHIKREVFIDSHNFLWDNSSILMKAKVTVQMKTGLVLEGGAMRGMFTAGVIDVLMENSIKFDGIIGVSAGAAFGCNYKSNQIGRVIRYNKRFNGDKNYMGIRPLLKEKNIVSTKYAYDIVPRELDPFDDEEYKKSDIPFYAVVTNVKTGKPEFRGEYMSQYSWAEETCGMLWENKTK